ncbi:hypothetical protein DSCW_00640 [Desulfosarcina widdelii]|uniref:Uncharacterized protein n=1 Tax=Desulfosarcina widdelii TaxID=947919 RepID=A0A5K7Z826_9BACT|nr:hypothetical protein DSCW_00640 [Desulfosarcina widdelii]
MNRENLIIGVDISKAHLDIAFSEDGSMRRVEHSEPNILVRHEGASCQRVQVPSGKLSVHPGSYPDSGLERSACWSSGDRCKPQGAAATWQAVTRVNPEQAPKGQSWTPTRPIFGKGRSGAGP